ncbi:MAG: dihydrolipoamide dehydrogenase [Thermococcaceae archaeon]|jgi:dihydrolipoamide dehydrogenase|nr:dihydrolipoamide dehydrogenase [Thermococcaceae archaeon]
MAINITMPKLGLTMNEGTIAEWRKKEKDPVEKDEVVVVVATDKLTFEVKAPESGILAKILVKEGETAKVAEVIGIIAAQGEDLNQVVVSGANTTEKKVEITDGKDEGKKKIVVIGAGPGGYVAAIRAAQLGADVTLIEKRELGGTCLNLGCIPTKVLAHTAELFATLKEGSTIGLFAESLKVDWQALMKRKEQVVVRLRNGIKGLMAANKIKVLKGSASFLSPKEIKVESQEGAQTVKADNVIIATGSVPAMPPIEGIDEEGVISSNEILSLEEPPKSLCIVGGGVIGIEFASIFSSFGTKVTVVEMMPEILPNVDEEIVGVLKKLLSARGVEFYTSAKVTKFSQNGGLVTVDVEFERENKKIGVEKVLVAVGRRPSTDKLNAEKVGIKMDRGRFVVDRHLETSVAGVYAIGDCASPIMLAHVASMEGEVAAENIMGHKVEVDYKTNPGCIYTFPEIASVGLTEKMAKDKGFDVVIGRFPMAANGKSLIMNETEGLVKFVVDRKYNEILGVHIIGPRATDLIVEGALAIRLEATVEEIISTIHAHPTIGEALREAAMDVNKISLHIPPR